MAVSIHVVGFPTFFPRWGASLKPKAIREGCWGHWDAGSIERHFNICFCCAALIQLP